jgi:hypothetical protein
MSKTKSCPPKKRVAATEVNRTTAEWFCSGLSVPRSSGRRGHLSILKLLSEVLNLRLPTLPSAGRG